MPKFRKPILKVAPDPLLRKSILKKSLSLVQLPALKSAEWSPGPVPPSRAVLLTQKEIVNFFLFPAVDGVLDK
jgi:hypothetical protein